MPLSVPLPRKQLAVTWSAVYNVYIDIHTYYIRQGEARGSTDRRKVKRMTVADGYDLVSLDLCVTRCLLLLPAAAVSVQSLVFPSARSWNTLIPHCLLIPVNL